jgi:hypothetical protein
VLHCKSSRLEALRKQPKRITPVVMQCDIVAAPKPLIRWHGDHCHTARFQNAKSLFHSLAVIIDVFKYIEGDHRIKACIHKGKLGPTGLDDICVPALAAEIEGHWFDINAGGRSDTPEGI